MEKNKNKEEKCKENLIYEEKIFLLKYERKVKKKIYFARKKRQIN